MKICLMSDIHLEFWDRGDEALQSFVDQVPECDLIVLAGDIGTLYHTYDQIIELINALSKKGKVLYVPGNHEFYHLSLKDGNSWLEKLANQCNNTEVFVHPRYYDFNGYSILGGSLWFPNLMASPREKSWMADFKYIYGFEESVYLENDAFVKLFNSSCAYPNKTIVISHHAPSVKSIHPRFKNSPINQFFLTELEEDIIFRKPLCWLHGHLHDPVDYYIGTTRIVSNALGYPNEYPYDWQPKVIEV